MTEDERLAAIELRNRGNVSGHRVSVTPWRFRWAVDCSCGLADERQPSKSAANLRGLAHLREALT